MPTWDQEADLEEGDLTDFDATVAADGGSIAASAASAKNGTYGLACTLTLGTAGDTAYGRLTGPVAETSMTAECWLDPNSLTMANGDAFVIVGLVTDGGGFSWAVFVYLRYSSATGYGWQLNVYNDAGVATTTTGSFSDGWHLIRVVWSAATGAGNNDGKVHLYIDGVLASSGEAFDTDTITIREVRFGAVAAIDAGTGGTFYMDDCRWADVIEHSLSLAGTLTPAGALNLKTKISMGGTLTPAGALTTLVTRIKRLFARATDDYLIAEQTSDTLIAPVTIDVLHAPEAPGEAERP